MEKNVGKTDKIIRYFIAIVSVILAFTVHWVFFIVAIVAAGTAFFSFCGLYKLLGINTCKRI